MSAPTRAILESWRLQLAGTSEQLSKFEVSARRATKGEGSAGGSGSSKFPEVKGHTFVANRWGGHRRTPRQSKNMNQFFHGSLPSGTTPTTVDVGPNGFTVAIYLSDARSIDAVLTNRDAGLAAHMLAIYHPKDASHDILARGFLWCFLEHLENPKSDFHRLEDEGSQGVEGASIFR